MMRCEQCRPLILDHLYGLLDGPEADAVEAHLRECAACAGARDEEARVQGLIARAAKGAFPQVRFEAPARTTAPVNPTPLATPALARGAQPTRTGRSARVSAWLPWAVAAAVLVAIPGTVVPVLRVLERARETRAEAVTVVAQADRASKDVETAERQVNRTLADAVFARVSARQAYDNLLNQWAGATEAVFQAANDRSKMAVVVHKPAAVQPGAPNEFLLTVRDRGTTPNPRILAEVRDQTDAVIYSEKIDVEKQPEAHLRLPAEAWTKLTPQSELFLVIASLDEKTGARTELQDKIRLSGPVYTTMLATDKPAYRPGETVYFRSLTLDRVTFKPPAREQFLQYELRCDNRVPVRGLAVVGGTDLVRVVDGKVEPLHGPDGKPIRGVGTGAFPLPPNLDDGDYTLVLREQAHPAGYPPAVPFPVVRPIRVKSGSVEVYRKEIGFAGAKSYSPGDTVEAWAELKFEDKPVAGAAIEPLVTADGQKIEASAVQSATGPDGRAHVHFTLPRELERADVRLKVTFHARGVDGRPRDESVAERVPVVGRNLVVEFFPEGGNLVAGVPCRVYVRATTPDGVPADIRGVVTDGRQELARVVTLTDPALSGANRGIGGFTFTPALGTPTWLRLDGGVFTPLLDGAFPTTPAAVAGAPAVAAVRTRFTLPTPEVEGVVMTVPNPVTGPGEPFRVQLRSVGKDRNLVVGAYTRGRLSDTRKVTVRPGELIEVPLMANSDPRGGVVRVTVFEEPAEEPGQPKPGQQKPDLKPAAERLVFRRPGESLNLALATAGTRSDDARGFVPGTAAELSITATDEKGNPAPAILWAAAVNSGVAPGPRDRLLTTHFLLAGEISTPDALEHADFLLTDHPKATQALDLVLATQGWRRFTEQTPAPVGRGRQPQPVTTDLAALQAWNGQYPTVTGPGLWRDESKILEKYRPLYEAAKKNLEAAEARAEAVKADRSGEDRVRGLKVDAERVRRLAAASAERAEAAAGGVERFQRAGWYGVAGFGLLAVMLGVVCLARPISRLPLGVGTAGSAALVAFLVVALGKAEDLHAAALPGDDPKVQLPEDTAQAARTTEFIPPPRPRGEEPKAAEASGSGMTIAMPGKGAFGMSAIAPQSGQKFTPPGPPEPKEGPPVPPNVMPRPDKAVPETPNPGGPPAAGGLGGGGPKGGGGGGFGGVGARPAAVPGKDSAPPKNFAPPLPPGGVQPFAPTAPVVPAIQAAPSPQGVPGAPRAPVGGGGWQPGGKLIGDDEIRQRESHGVRTLSASVGRMTVQSAGAGLAGAVTLSDAYHRDMQLVQRYAQQQAQDKVEELYQAFAYKHSIPVEQLKEKVKETMGKVMMKAETTKGDGAKTEAHVGPARKVPFAKRKGEAEALGMPGLPPDVLAFFGVQSSVPATPPLVVREYAAPRPGSTEAIGGYESDTILWQPVIALPADGKAKLNFTLGSAPGGYQVIVAGHTLDGRIGAVQGMIPIAPPAPAAPVAQPGPIPPEMP